MGSERRALPLLALLLIAPGCGGAPCRKACSKLASCVGEGGDAGITYRSSSNQAQDETAAEPGQFACTLSAECSPKESCLSECIAQASCAAIRVPRGTCTTGSSRQM